MGRQVTLGEGFRLDDACEVVFPGGGALTLAAGQYVVAADGVIVDRERACTLATPEAAWKLAHLRSPLACRRPIPDGIARPSYRSSAAALAEGCAVALFGSALVLWTAIATGAM